MDSKSQRFLDLHCSWRLPVMGVATIGLWTHFMWIVSYPYCPWLPNYPRLPSEQGLEYFLPNEHVLFGLSIPRLFLLFTVLLTATISIVAISLAPYGRLIGAGVMLIASIFSIWVALHVENMRHDLHERFIAFRGWHYECWENATPTARYSLDDHLTQYFSLKARIEKYETAYGMAPKNE